MQTTPDTNTDALRKHVKDGTTEKYATTPPSFGPHWASPIYPSREFYIGARPAARWNGWSTTSSTATPSSGTTRR